MATKKTLKRDSPSDDMIDRFDYRWSCRQKCVETFNFLNDPVFGSFGLVYFLFKVHSFDL